ncbi:hypothetical protein [Campylobacter showae]|uniref:hypothetical protein n=1 Tax=Campylobacter showae TaxID=204 RepID=UPI0028D74071|nr:hypothetical protein [Campylobacter showae]
MAKNKGDTGSIVTYDPYLQTSYAFSNNKIFPTELSKANKNSFFISYVKYKDITVGSVEIPISTEEDDTSNLITIKAYEQFNLDPATEYKIVYNEVPNISSDTKIFNVFISDVLSTDKLYSLAIKKIPFIDYVVPAPLAFDALYKKNILSTQDTEAFIVIQEDDAFIAVYYNGEYIQSRPLRYSIKNISEKFATLSGDKLNDSAFLNILKHGTNTPDDKNKNFITEIFDEIAYYIGDIVNSLSRFNGSSISSIYIVADAIMGDFAEFMQEKLNIPTKNLELNIAINSKEIEISNIHNIMVVNAQYYKETQENDFNFSNFLRPLPLFQRSSGKLVTYVLVGLLLGLLHPLYLYVSGIITDIDTADKKSEYEINNADKIRIEGALAAIDQQISDTSKLIEAEQEKINFRKNTISEIYDKKVNYPMKGIVLFELSNLINNKDIQTAKINNSDRNMTVTLVSKDEKKLTELIQNVSNSERYSILTREILLDKNYGVLSYETNVTIKIK